MKSILSVFALGIGILLPFSSTAQSVQVGVKAGLNLANIYGEDTDGGLIKAGILAGGLLHVPVTDQFAFQPELLLAQQGTRGEEGSITIRFNNTYLLLPLMSKMYITPNVVLQLGPQLGFLLSSKLKGKTGGIDTSVDTKDLYKSADLGFNIGLSYESPSRFVVTTRKSIGLTNVIDDQIGDVNSKNTARQLSLAYRFLPNSQ